MDYQALITLILAGMAVIGNIFIIYNHFRNPDIKAAKRLDVLETSCPLKHDKIDYIIGEIRKNLSEMNERITLIQENDIKHIEQEIRIVSERQNKILTILEYKENKKI